MTSAAKVIGWNEMYLLVDGILVPMKKKVLGE